ncbi:MAG: hypothetical protein KME31_27970 [Tolypothrix carrinoi HA7290-LM1]|nr:hypothetical protein [Tolypothrix carrinoi HA7290-LM1]
MDRYFGNGEWEWGSARQGDKETRRQGDKETRRIILLSPHPPLSSFPIPHSQSCFMPLDTDFFEAEFS